MCGRFAALVIRCMCALLNHFHYKEACHETIVCKKFIAVRYRRSQS